MEANKIIITGGATRIGAAIAKKLSGPGVEIVIHYNKSEAQAKSLKKKLENYNIKLHCVKADLSKDLELKKLFIKSKKKIGNINCLINNASTFELDNINNIDNI